jgi:hypothetical protein
VCRSSAIAGKPGMYMSIAKAPTETRRPKTIARRRRGDMRDLERGRILLFLKKKKQKDF